MAPIRGARYAQYVEEIDILQSGEPSFEGIGIRFLAVVALDRHVFLDIFVQGACSRRPSKPQVFSQGVTAVFGNIYYLCGRVVRIPPTRSHQEPVPDQLDGGT